MLILFFCHFLFSAILRRFRQIFSDLKTCNLIVPLHQSLGLYTGSQLHLGLILKYYHCYINHLMG